MAFYSCAHHNCFADEWEMLCVHRNRGTLHNKRSPILVDQLAVLFARFIFACLFLSTAYEHQEGFSE